MARPTCQDEGDEEGEGVGDERSLVGDLEGRQRGYGLEDDERDEGHLELQIGGHLDESRADIPYGEGLHRGGKRGAETDDEYGFSIYEAGLNQGGVGREDEVKSHGGDGRKEEDQNKEGKGGADDDEGEEGEFDEGGGEEGEFDEGGEVARPNRSQLRSARTKQRVSDMQHRIHLFERQVSNALEEEAADIEVHRRVRQRFEAVTDVLANVSRALRQGQAMPLVYRDQHDLAVRESVVEIMKVAYEAGMEAAEMLETLRSNTIQVKMWLDSLEEEVERIRHGTVVLAVSL